jgi:hypothetical protein
MASHLEIAGDVIETATLMVSKARDLAERLRDERIPFARFVQCRRLESNEIVILDVDVELGQLRTHDIQPTERVAVIFTPDEAQAPEVWTLREDFPQVPHLNLRPYEVPHSLCLFDEPFLELKARWTSAMFVERIRDWLRLTARGELHANDQALEPLILGGDGTIVVPCELTDGKVNDRIGVAIPLEISQLRDHNGRMVLVARRTAQVGQDEGTNFVAVAITMSARRHGVIRRTPRNLADLHDLLADGGSDNLLAVIRSQILSWKALPGALKARLVMIVLLPKTRDLGGIVESTEAWAFLSQKTVEELGIATGCWDVHNGQIGALLIPDTKKRGDDVPLGILNVVPTVSRETVAHMNGASAPYDALIAAVGTGALGSQVIINCIRGAFGQWTPIDKDLLLPHNLARHALSADAVGWPKAEGLAGVGNQIMGVHAVREHLVADVLDPRAQSAKLAQILRDAEMIVDQSASVSVARTVARMDAGARRVSLFLNPTGTDLVLLAEDKQRSVPLDALEMQYYRALRAVPALAGHLRPPNDRVRYGRGCRDVSVRLPQDHVAVHAAIGARALRSIAADDAARINVWRLNPQTMALDAVQVPVAAPVSRTSGSWTIVTDETVVSSVREARRLKLANETGGVLLGTFDLERRIVYIVDMIASPPDSVEWPVLYIRGCQGLTNQLATVRTLTMEQVGYVGEWHSHPDGHSCARSEDDQKVLNWLCDHMDAQGMPAIMVIVGQDDFEIHSQEHTLREGALASQP